MVARDHDDAHARLVAGLDRLDDLFAGRVDHARDADKGHVVLYVGSFVFGHGGPLAHGKAEDAQGAFAHAVAQRQYLFAVGVGHVAHALRRPVFGAQGQHLVHRALGIGDVLAAHVVDDGHALAVGIEGLFEQALVRFFVLLAVDAELFGKVDEGAFGGVAEDMFGVIGILFGVAAQGAAVQEVAVHPFAVLLRQRFGGRRFAALEVVADGDGGDGHFIEGEGTRLVAADDGGGAERFYRGQRLDQGVLLRHPLYAQRHDDGAGGGQALGDDGDGEGNGDEDIVDPRFPAVADEPDGEDGHADDEADQAERFAHGIELALHGGVRLVLLVEHAGDLAHFRVHARADDDARRVAVHDDGRTVRHVDAIAERRVFRQHGGAVLFGRDGLARQGGFLHLHVGVFDDADIGGDDAAVFQIDDIARHQFGSGHHALFPLAQHARGGRRHVAQRL